jgi:hypothetical protein
VCWSQWNFPGGGAPHRGPLLLPVRLLNLSILWNICWPIRRLHLATVSAPRVVQHPLSTSKLAAKNSVSWW